MELLPIRAWQCPDQLWQRLEKEEHFGSFFTRPNSHSNFKLATLQQYLREYLPQCSEPSNCFLFDLFAGCGGTFSSKEITSFGSPIYLLQACKEFSVPVENLFCAEINAVYFEFLKNIMALCGGEKANLLKGPWGRELIKVMN